MKHTTKWLMLAMALSGSLAFSQRAVTYPLPGQSIPGQSGQIEADLYGDGVRGVVLAHGGRFNKESWRPQAKRLAEAGFLVLAIRFRGDRLNPDGSPGSFGSAADNATDILASVSYLRKLGATTISAVGASFGGDAVGEADALSQAGSIARIVILGSTGGDMPEKLSGRKLFIVARQDKSGSGLRLPEIIEHYNRVQQPKKLVILDGSAHAQFLFQTGQGPQVMNTILKFLEDLPEDPVQNSR